MALASRVNRRSKILTIGLKRTHLSAIYKNVTYKNAGSNDPASADGFAVMVLWLLSPAFYETAVLGHSFLLALQLFGQFIAVFNMR